ncbi:hypothetical protein ABIB40_002148 [Pedobacter sp. UYP30]|uniref:DUF6157 family protein n=1 Tax=Pedobacter sp. UYP30 TaxID=1756400 RepID=UPI003395A955
MKVHTTNYFDTFIEVAEDTKADFGKKPPVKAKKSIAEMQYELIANQPYQYTSDDVFFKVYAERNDITEAALRKARVEFFAKGQPCFRASPLPKTYGFGIHCSSEGKVALHGMETAQYRKFLADEKSKK